MTGDETMEFELNYEGQKTTASCVWLCENLDNWSSDITDADWLELMAYYEGIKAKGPDASIDWSGSATVTVQDVDDEGNPVEKEVTVTDLDEPLVWDDEVASTRANTRRYFQPSPRAWKYLVPSLRKTLMRRSTPSWTPCSVNLTMCCKTSR